MENVHINVGKGYNVAIGGGLLASCGEALAEVLPPCRAGVITDSTVAGLYLDTVTASLKAGGFDPVSFIFPAGEGSKNLSTLSDILEFMAASGLTRGDCAVALGGGVVGDVTGFAAGCYMRGIPCVQLPTTLLAAVDSSVGGKTAVDLGAGKNLAGLFVQPKAVICDTDTLATLPPSVFADGAAEAIKAGILSDEGLFALFESANVHSRLTEIITRCVAFKGGIVEADELETGIRKTLNLGHTVGHAIEKCSGYSVTHGHAVAIGTAVIARAADKLGLSDGTVAPRIEAVLLRNGLSTKIEFTAAELAAVALSDKKRTGDGITVVLPSKIGWCQLKTIPVGELEAFISAGM